MKTGKPATRKTTDKPDMISGKKFDGVIKHDFNRLRKYGVVFTDGTKGDIRTSKTRKALLETGKYKHVAEVKREPNAKAL